MNYLIIKDMNEKFAKNILTFLTFIVESFTDTNKFISFDIRVMNGKSFKSDQRYIKINIEKLSSSMQPQSSSNRFQHSEEVFNNQGTSIGFTLPGNSFLFKYQSDGGWYDEKGTKFNSEGLIESNNAVESEDDSQDDEEILDEFQKMLDDDDPKKNKNHRQKITKKKQEQKFKQKQPLEDIPEDTIDYQQETNKYIEQYKNKQKIRDGLLPQLFIYFKMKSKYYVQIQPKVQSLQSTDQKNQKIKQISEEAKKQTEKLKQKNKWLTENAIIDFSGICQDDNIYQRYWCGHIKANIENYLELKKAIEDSQEFALLESKTFYALKSKFYLKKKMRQTIQGLCKQLDGLEDDNLVILTANDLPEYFPCSYVLDLFDYTGTKIEEVHSIKLIDEYTAELYLSKAGALKFFNVQGFCHGEKQYIYIDIQLLKEPKKLIKSQLIKITTDSPYKLHSRELFDVMGLVQSKAQIAKMATQQEQKKEGYRLIMGRQALRKILMYRGSSLNITKIQLFVKK